MGSCSERAAATADQPKGPSVTTCTMSGRFSLHSLTSRFLDGKPNRNSPYAGTGTPLDSTSSSPAREAESASLACLGLTTCTACPRWRRPSTIRPRVMATPLTSGGKVSVTIAIRKLGARTAKDSTNSSYGWFTAIRVPVKHNSLMMIF